MVHSHLVLSIQLFYTVADGVVTSCDLTFKVKVVMVVVYTFMSSFYSGR